MFFTYGNFRAGNEVADFGFLGREDEVLSERSFLLLSDRFSLRRRFLNMSASKILTQQHPTSAHIPSAVEVRTGEFSCGCNGQGFCSRWRWTEELSKFTLRQNEKRK